MKKFILLLLLCLPIYAQAACDAYAAKHSAQTHSANICSCENCHYNGIFKGTPTTCIGCHKLSGIPNITRTPLVHIRTDSIACETCHKSSSSWLTVSMSHTSVAGFTCETCHNNFNAIGKPSEHIQTTATCSLCHTKTSSWDAKMNHTGIVTGCSSCHSKDKTTSHIPTTASCETCHTGTTTWVGGRYSHTGAENCATCHANQAVAATVTQKSATHIPTNEDCKNCHTGTTTFKCL